MDWKSRVRAAFTSHVPDEDVIEELAQHAASMYSQARADGMSPRDADERVAALVRHWAQDPTSLRHRAHRPAPVPPSVSQPAPRHSGVLEDVTYAARVLIRAPRLAFLSIATIALGIGLTTIFFSVAYALLLKPLPWPAGDRLIALRETRGGQAPRFLSFTNAAYQAWRGGMGVVDDIAAWSQRTSTLTDAGHAERIRITAASASLFRVLGVRPLIGSFFDAASEGAADGVIVLSEGLWRRRYAADTSVIGRVVSVDGQPSRIVGILADDMLFPDRRTEAIVPFRVPNASPNMLSLFDAVGRLRPDASPAQAAAEGTARARFAPDTGLTTTAVFGVNGAIEIAALPLRDAMTADVRRPIVILLVAVGLLLAAATTNVAGLQLARAAMRHREMAIRAALGAGTRRLVRQLLAETLLIGMCGGAGGLVLASLLHRLLPLVLPADFPRAGEVELDAVVALFGVASSIVAAVLFGLLPAVYGSRLNLVDALAADGSNSIVPGGRGARARARLAIVGAQVAIACLLLAGASMLGRSLLALLTADRGYQPAGVLTARVSFPPSMYTEERRSTILAAILDRVRRVPAVSEAAFTSEFPLVPGGSTSSFTLQRPGADAVILVQASPLIVSPRYFHALGIRIVAGRAFSDADTDATEPSVMVNRAFARRYLDDNALGQKLPMAVGYGHAGGRPERRAHRPEATVIGVVEDVRPLQASTPSRPEIYYSYLQLDRRLPVPTVTLLLRTPGDPIALAGMLRSTMQEADRALVPEAVATMEDRMWTGLVRPRLYATLFGVFALCSLTIAAVGLFGALSQIVAQRSRELALRAALGAPRSAILNLVVGHAFMATGTGLVIGLTSAIALMRVIESQLYGVAVVDPITLTAVPGLVLLVAMTACLVPVFRAVRVDPAQVLRR